MFPRWPALNHRSVLGKLLLSVLFCDGWELTAFTGFTQEPADTQFWVEDTLKGPAQLVVTEEDAAVGGHDDVGRLRVYSPISYGIGALADEVRARLIDFSDVQPELVASSTALWLYDCLTAIAAQHNCVVSVIPPGSLAGVFFPCAIVALHLQGLREVHTFFVPVSTSGG